MLRETGTAQRRKKPWGNYFPRAVTVLRRYRSMRKRETLTSGRNTVTRFTNRDSPIYILNLSYYRFPIYRNLCRTLLSPFQPVDSVYLSIYPCVLMIRPPLATTLPRSSIQTHFSPSFRTVLRVRILYRSTVREKRRGGDVLHAVK